MIPLDWVHLQRNIAEGYAPVIRVTGFGKGPEVPRYLRCDGEINFPEMSMAEAEAQVSALWRAKRESDSITGRLLHVGDYMYSWARKVAGSQEPRRAVHAAYRLLVSCCTHASKSPQIRLFLEVTRSPSPMAVPTPPSPSPSPSPQKQQQTSRVLFPALRCPADVL